MSYLAFHAVFTLPIILLLAIRLPQSSRIEGWSAWSAIGLIACVAFIYTTPWDNYLVARNVWWYGPDRVVTTIGHVPLEEYMFFMLQPVLSGLFLFHYLLRSDSVPASSSERPAWIGSLAFFLLAVASGAVLAVGFSSGTYMALILLWAAPLLSGMWLYGGQTLWAYRRMLGPSVAIPTVYLWIADATAIHNEIWTISDTYTLGVSPLGFPLAEATFFLVTNLLVVQGLLLLFYGSHQAVATTVTDLEGRTSQLTS